jgi:hypothetical protein
MRGGAVVVLLGITAWAAYTVGRQSAPVSNPPPVAATAMPKSDLAKPVAFAGPAMQVPERVPTSGPSSDPAPSTKVSLPQITEPAGTEAKPSGSNIKRKVEIGLTAAAIAAIIVQASRAEYHAGGRPCACPDDTARNGSACGGRSAYSRPGGASPLCYPSDVTAAMIEAYRQRQASR